MNTNAHSIANAANIAQRVSRFAQSCIESAARHGESEASALAVAGKFARERAQGGKARTSKGVVIGYRFADGSAVTANFVEFLGEFVSERRKAAATPGTPVTDGEIRAAGDRAMELAVDTLAQRRPFLGVFGAADESGIADAGMAKVCGWAYLCIIQQNTTSITTNVETGMLVAECFNDAGRALAARAQA